MTAAITLLPLHAFMEQTGTLYYAAFPNGAHCTKTSLVIRSIIVTSPFTYLLTPWSRVFLEKLTGSHLVKKFPTFYGTRRFITAFTSARHSLSWARPIQSMPPHPTSWRSILTSPHLRLGLPTSLFPSGFPTKTLYTPLLFPIRATCPANIILLEHQHLVFKKNKIYLLEFRLHFWM